MLATLLSWLQSCCSAGENNAIITSSHELINYLAYQTQPLCTRIAGTEAHIYLWELHRSHQTRLSIPCRFWETPHAVCSHRSHSRHVHRRHHRRLCEQHNTALNTRRCSEVLWYPPRETLARTASAMLAAKLRWLAFIQPSRGSQSC